ncbi:MAG TPA: NADPH-dependent glutamate synthase [Mesotoga infera]|jgi:glutamate synthase (NADPH/NADH) small chain|nr:NADPH-dependent glutamate synthase [Mesotoga sp.]NLI06184.1 NADPH-dependent glutamate synthase [Thermotogaceae bacterium]HOI34060.1 NADPH-dependent glutamate synthase [Mesotoga infera]HON28652.1 NADPH-dependent glutamate synthase [Mesotoga infera]HPD37571.1 NADPH-dependent glutamate synthase [Mesotoga infera]
MPEKNKTKMRELDPIQRIGCFEEVALGYSKEEALKEAARCLQCKNQPCVSGCPVGINIPGFIKALREERYKDSAMILKGDNNLPAVCGRVCPQEKQCEARCILGRVPGGDAVAIGRLERFVADLEIPVESVVKPSIHKKVAVIGAGPAGLTVAADLAKEGVSVTVFEAFHTAGGVLVYGIPEFRLPKKIVSNEVQFVQEMGVEFRFNEIVGRTVPFEELVNDYDAVFIGIGAGAPRFMGIPGTNLNNIFSASEFLTRVNLMKAYLFPKYDTPVKIKDRVAVIGAGNVTMDAARTARRLGAKEVHIVYRRSEEEMPARLEEYHHAMEEGIKLHCLTLPVEYLGDANNNVVAMKCVKMTLGEPDSSGRRRPVQLENSEFTMEVDMVIEAIGQTPNAVLKAGFSSVQLNKWGSIQADEETGRTNLPKVFAGGDIVTGAATVIEAMGAGKRSAKAILKYLAGV